MEGNVGGEQQMNDKERKSNYDKYPTLHIDGFHEEVSHGYTEIVDRIRMKIKQLKQQKTVVVLDYYHGVRQGELEEELIHKLEPDVKIFAETAKLPENELYPLLARNLGDDRVFGVLSTFEMKEFYDSQKLAKLQAMIEEKEEGILVVYGVGASLVCKGDILIYGDMPRWEIQLRYRSKELDNWGVGNFDEDILRKYKRGYFIEWRVMDRHKKELFDDIDFFLDTTKEHDPKMIIQKAFHHAMHVASAQPFRLMPYFDEGIWGGKWMERVCDLKPKHHNYAWCFDGVPEENSILIRFDDIVVEMPSMNVVLSKPTQLLGAKVRSRFGSEFPIRFDFLDTMEGGNLSLQVHPLTEYIQENFGMHYTQDESYYIVDASEGACVYLGVKDGVSEDDLLPALKRAETGMEVFDDTKYINKFAIKKHDHVLIPAGTIHCSGSSAMVLEISATPYIFTMKLWDWGRVGLDGLPRPINVDRGAKAIQYDRTTKWVSDNLLNNIQVLQEDAQVKIERTGLHELEFIETRRYWFHEALTFQCDDSVNMLNLIEGEEVTITSLHGQFDPFIVHYAETFIVPESVKEYCITPSGLSTGKKVALIKASVRL